VNFRLSNRTDWQRLVEYVKRLPFQRDGKQVFYRVSVEELKSTRSLEANSRYWALLTAISQQAPAHMHGVYYRPETWHEEFKRQFLGVELGPLGTPIAKSTAKLGVAGFGEYMQQVEAWAYTELTGFQFEREAA